MMLTFRKGSGGAASAMSEYLRESDVSEAAMRMAAYYSVGLDRAPQATGTVAEPRADMHALVSEALGIQSGKEVTHEELTNILRGLRADGSPLPGNQRGATYNDRERITYYDFTFSAPKSVSVAMGLAKTEEERRLLVGLHRQAVREGMAYLETIVGHARVGQGGSKGTMPGHIGWISFDHFTARPVAEIPTPDGTVLQSVGTAGDPQLHSHCITPNLVCCDEDGRVGSLHTAKLHGAVHTVGAYYQVRLGQLLREHGIATETDQKTGLLKLSGVSDELVDLFSKRTVDGDKAARKYAEDKGIVWDDLHHDAKITLLKTAAQSARNPKEAQANWDSWPEQAKTAGLPHETVLNTAPKMQAPTGEEHIEAAYQAALPLLEREMEQRSVLSASAGRYAAVRGFMQTGISAPEDIDKVTALMRSDGVRDEGHGTKLIVARVNAAPGDGSKPEVADPEPRLTTRRHLDQEREVIRLAQSAAADKKDGLTQAKIEKAVQVVSARDGLDFTSTDHGKEQRKAIDALGTAGRFSVLNGVAGSGKTTLLRPLVHAWNEDGRRVIGTAIARRQSDALVDAGIRQSNAMPIHQLLKRGGKARKGGIVLDRKTVVVADELSQISTRQLLKLMKLQEKHAFRILAIGDHMQNQSIEAGSSINLLRKALVKDGVPELLSSVRQVRERDRETALLFRNGKAEEGIKRLDEDGQFRVVPGGYRQAIDAAADMWVERHKANADRKDYSLTISAPTNTEARDISAAIRERKRDAGTLGPDRITLEASDQNGAEYSLPLAVGDRVRLFRFTHGTLNDGRTAAIGNNGSVLTVEDVRDDGVRLRTSNGTSGYVRWDALKAESGRVMLSYGDALTADAIQGATSREHLNVMAAGSAEVHAFKTYPAQSRSRDATWMIVSEGRETAEVLARRALGTDRTVTRGQIRENVARNLSRQPSKELATDLVAGAEKVFEGGLRTLTQAERDAARQHTTAQPYDAAQRAAQRQQAAQQSAILSL